MKYTFSNHKLKDIIDELGEEYKDLLIEQVLDETRETDVNSINLSSLIKLDVEIKTRLTNSYKYRKRYKSLTLMSIVGLLYALIGIIMLLILEIQESISTNNIIMSSVIILIGLFVALFALMYRNLLNLFPPKYKKSHISSYEIVNQWKRLEATINQITPKSSELSFNDIIDTLIDTHIITVDDYDLIKKLLHYRNIAVHTDDIEILKHQDEIHTILINTDKLIVKLQKFI